jgi:hypothetical protein
VATYEDVVAELVATDPDVSAGQMFGMPTLKTAKLAFAGRTGPDMVFKLSGTAQAAALKLKGAHLFDLMGGRPMKEWVVVPMAHSRQWPKLAAQARDYLRA